MAYHASVPDREESFLPRAIDILSRRRTLALVIFTAVLVSGLSFTRFLPDLYRASAIVLVEQQLPETFVRSAVSNELESRLHVIKQETLSRARLTDLIHRFDLYPELRAKNDMEGALEQMRHDIHVELTGPEQVSGRTKTVAFSLTFTGVSPETVAEVTNAITAFYVGQNNQMRSREAARTTHFLKAQLDEAKKQLEKHEQVVRDYTAKYVGQLPQQVEVNLASLERLNTQLRLNGERQLRTLEQREKLAETTRGAPALAAAATDSPDLARLEELKEDLAQLERRVMPQHPDVKRLKNEIELLEQEIETSEAERAPAEPAPAGAPVPRIRTRTLQTLDGELAELKTEEARLRQSIGTFEQRLESVPYRQNEFALISRDHQAAKEIYDSLLARYKEAQLAETMETENEGERFRILESAVAPAGPNAPNRPRLLVMSLLLAVLIAGMVVLTVEQFDTSFHGVDDVRQFTSVPVLAAIPAIGPPAGRRWLVTACATASILAGLFIVGSLSAHLARDNEQLVRLLVRGG